MSEKGKVVTPAAPGLINKEDIPQVLPILPLRNSVFFPGGVLPLAVGRQKTIALIKDAVRDDQVIGVVTQRKAEEEDPGAADLHSMGTVARIVKLLKMGEDNYSLVVQGLARFRVVELVQEHPYLKARIEAVEDKTSAENVEIEALANKITEHGKQSSEAARTTANDTEASVERTSMIAGIALALLLIATCVFSIFTIARPMRALR